MTEYDPVTMLPVDKLKDLYDLSGLTLYKAEAGNIPQLTPEAEKALLHEARLGSVEARNRLIVNCVAFTILQYLLRYLCHWGVKEYAYPYLH